MPWLPSQRWPEWRFPRPRRLSVHRADAVADPPLTLVRTIPVGGSPDSIVVDCWSGRNDVIFYDLASSKVKFLDGDSLQLTPDEIYLPHRGFDSWMTYDRNLGHTYLLQVVREFDWDNLMVTVLNRRYAGAFILRERGVQRKFAGGFSLRRDRLCGQAVVAGDRPAGPAWRWITGTAAAWILWTWMRWG